MLQLPRGLNRCMHTSPGELYNQAPAVSPCGLGYSELLALDED